MSNQVVVRKYEELQKTFANAKEWPFSMKRLNNH